MGRKRIRNAYLGLKVEGEEGGNREKEGKAVESAT